MEILDLFHTKNPMFCESSLAYLHMIMWRCSLNQPPDYYALHAVVTLQQNHPET